MRTEKPTGLFVPSWILSLTLAFLLTGIGSALTYWFQFGKIEERVAQIQHRLERMESVDSIKRDEWRMFVEDVRRDLSDLKRESVRKR